MNEIPKNYNFVPFPFSVKNDYITDIAKRRGNNSGYVELEIITVDNLFIGSGFFKYDEKQSIGKIISETHKIIPGSSLKGAVRQVARAATESCIPHDKIEVPVLDKDGEPIIVQKGGRRGVKSKLEAPLLSEKQSRQCNAKPDKNGVIKICIICDMFGAMSLGSKVRFTDFKSDKLSTELVKVPQQFSPDTASSNYWYYDDNDSVLYKGYKFYYTECDERKLLKKTTVSAVKKGEIFTGRIYFNGLFDEQLELLLYSLGVGKNISLKLGGYKADGFGTVKTKCISLVVNGEKKDGAALAQKFAKKNADYLTDLEYILKYRER